MLNILIFDSQKSVIGSPTPAYFICICLIREIDLQHLCWFLYLSSSCNAAWIHGRPLWDSTFLSDVYQDMAVLMPRGGCRGNLLTRWTSWYHDSSQSPCTPFPIQYNLIFFSRTDAACKLMAKWRRLPISLPLLTACKLCTPEQQLCPQTLGKAAFKDYFCSLSIRKPLYPINLLATGYFTLRSIMFSEKEQVMKVPFGLTSNVFLDELQPGKLLGSFWNVKSIKPFNTIML